MVVFTLRLVRRGHQLAGSSVFELGREVPVGLEQGLCGREAALRVLASLNWGEGGSMKLRPRPLRRGGSCDGRLGLMSLRARRG